jgi:hypothetical protein
MINIIITNPADLIDIIEYCDREDEQYKVEYRGTNGILESIRQQNKNEVSLVDQLKRTNTKPMNMREFLAQNDQ